MKSFALLCVVCLFAGTGALRGAEGEPAPKKKAPAGLGRAAAALDTIQKALRDLPPGADVEQIKKALARLREEIVKDLQGRLSVARDNVEMLDERAGWSERMVAKGFLTRAQARHDRARAEAAALLVQRLRDDLKVLGATR